MVKHINVETGKLGYDNYFYMHKGKNLDQMLKEIGNVIYPMLDTTQLKFWYEEPSKNKQFGLAEIPKAEVYEKVLQLNRCAVILIEPKESNKIGEIYTTNANRCLIDLVGYSNDDNVYSKVIDMSFSLEDFFKFMQREIFQNKIDYRYLTVKTYGGQKIDPDHKWLTSG